MFGNMVFKIPEEHRKEIDKLFDELMAADAAVTRLAITTSLKKEHFYAMLQEMSGEKMNLEERSYEYDKRLGAVVDRGRFKRQMTNL